MKYCEAAEMASGTDPSKCHCIMVSKVNIKNCDAKMNISANCDSYCNRNIRQNNCNQIFLCNILCSLMLKCYYVSWSQFF